MALIIVVRWSPKALEMALEPFPAEVERVQKYSTQVKVPLHYWNFT